MRVLVTGSSGYIGSVLCKLLKSQGHYVLAADNNESHHRYYDRFFHGPIISEYLAHEVMSNNVDTVFHLAASADVSDSTIRPSLYYYNNVGCTAKMFDNFITRGWKGKVVFSSSAAVYGDSGRISVETDDTIPVNSYGTSKLFCETYFSDLEKVHNIPVVMFRYFNVAGAWDDVGDHHGSGHIVQKLCHSAKNDRPFKIFGMDYSTHDGTCVRDYVHVRDVCEAHLVAAEYASNGYSDIFNIGSTSGISVKELVEKFQSVTGESIEVIPGFRRPGDPEYLVSSPEKFISTTHYKFKYTIEDMISSAWEWYNRS